MIFAKDLLLKGGAGLALCVAAGVGGVKLYGRMNTETLKSLAEKVGLSCEGVLGNEGLECSIKTGGTENKLKAKKDSTTFDVSTISNGKIKVYKDETHNKGFKFSIENNDISEGSNKLEQFETYEIKEEGKQWRLTKKIDAKEGIKKALGLDDCDFPTNGSGEGCDIAVEKFKKVKFEGISDTEADAKTGTKLKITSESSTQEFPLGFKFVLISAQDTTISNSLTIKANTNTEFKIKRKENSNEITLEKAWTLDELVKKVGLETCTSGSDSTKECTLKDGSINVFEEDSKKIEGAKVKPNGTTKKLKVEENAENHNQGFKFYTEESDGIEICKEGQDSPSVTKIEKKETATYEIKQNGTNWYLAKKTTASS